MADFPIAGAPATIAASCHPVMQGWMPPLVEPHRRSGESLLYFDARLGLLLCRDADFSMFIGVGLHLLCMQWPSSCKSSSLPGRGSWIAERLPSSCGRKAWRPLRMRLGRCAWNVMLVVLMSMPSSGTSFPRRVIPVPSTNSSPTLVGHLVASQGV
jgi:hypothetical protein